ncbi:MAG TPA: hypothetical protein VNA25_07085 [Phycisphaerae bacterium]|nr:hypothetical protein [Phycisphaerae bacterium]
MSATSKVHKAKTIVAASEDLGDFPDSDDLRVRRLIRKPPAVLEEMYQLARRIIERRGT